MKGVYCFIIPLMLLLVSCTETKERNLGNGYFLTGYGAITEIYKKKNHKEDDIILLGGIVDYRANDNFILIYREVSEKVKNHFSDHPYSEIMRGGDTIQYWIITKQNDSVIGPLTKDEYLLKRSQLNIPNSIQLKE